MADRALLRRGGGKSAETRLVGLDPRFDALIATMHAANRREPPPARAASWLRSFVEATGAAVIGIVRDLVEITAFLGEAATAALRALRRPAQFRPIAIIHQIDRAGLGAVPIIVLITFLIGAIVAQQGIFHFSKFGAETYVVDMIGILTLRELAVLLVAIMLAGRSGSAYTAELGSMRMREETDAMRVMGLDPIEVLVLPRLIALVLVMPLLTFIGAMSALTGGGLVTWLYGGMSPDIYLDRLAGGDLAVDLRGRPHQGAIHGAGDRPHRLRRGLPGRGQRRIARPQDHGVGGEVDLHGDRAGRAVRHVLRRRGHVRAGP